MPTDENTFTSNDNNDIPYNGTFTPTWLNPFIKMQITDNAGCTRQVATNKALLIKEEPTITIESITGNGDIASCEYETACFRVILETNYIGNNGWLLPLKIPLTFDVVGYHATTNGEIITTPLSNGNSNFDLANVDNGDYSTIICYDHQGESVYFEYGLSVNSILPENFPVEGYYSFNIGNVGGASPSIVLCDESLGDGDVCPHVRSIELTVEPVGSCEETNIYGIPFSDICTGVTRFEGGSEGFVEINGDFHTYSSVSMKAYINPCLIEEQSPMESQSIYTDNKEAESLRDKKKSYSNTLVVKPNPFTDEVKVSYQIETENTATVTLRLLGSVGNEMQILLNKVEQSSGQYEANFSGKELPPGVYYYELIIDKIRIVEKVAKVSQF